MKHPKSPIPEMDVTNNSAAHVGPGFQGHENHFLYDSGWFTLQPCRHVQLRQAPQRIIWSNLFVAGLKTLAMFTQWQRTLSSALLKSLLPSNLGTPRFAIRDILGISHHGPWNQGVRSNSQTSCQVDNNNRSHPIPTKTRKRTESSGTSG